MAPADDRMAFLVKGKGPAARGRFALGPAGANIHFSAEPLFRSIGAAGRLGAAPSASQWFRVTADAGADSANPWDACHALMAHGQGVAGGGVEFAEPDLLQRWAVVPRPPSAAALAMREGRPHEQNKDDFPAIPADNFWFRDAKHGQFDAALVGLADPGAGKRTRIAHVDTGYDPDHRSRPIHLSQAEQRNFVDADTPNDAREIALFRLAEMDRPAAMVGIVAGIDMSDPRALAGAGIGKADERGVELPVLGIAEPEIVRGDGGEIVLVLLVRPALPHRESSGARGAGHDGPSLQEVGLGKLHAAGGDTLPLRHQRVAGIPRICRIGARVGGHAKPLRPTWGRPEP